ncbi:MAG: NADH-quinone oxidoreductase subunit NuoD [Candidatus Methanomethylophilaceae archaeon]|nr:NADH-quinone oxidoreductase subunit NuoD [Candidatus Methanomethylophilaceae archaeon]MDD3378382.1 NADH-quinone oxidoreductase subunit NuoD [Candidatus Methanomethylophilaceae archaeon]MDY0224264.1 NADH-quinone oxidoreductase subunit NuoD [Candidatus Methanomethylophilaceae archaeon]
MMAKDVLDIKAESAVMDTDKMWIIMGPQHPFSHGLWTLKIQVDGEIVKDAEPIVGYLHRGWEKEAEARSYPKIIPMADRLCYAASMTYTHLFCMTVEKALDIDVPEKAKYIRIVADEICRIQSHLMWLAAVGTDLGNFTVFLWCMREREFFMDLNVRLCGARMTTNYPRIGGVRNDTTELFDRDVMRCVERFEKVLMDDIVTLIDDSSVFVSRMKGVGYLTREQTVNLGITGPAMRGAGVDFDIRRDDPYDNYDKIDFDVPVMTQGDSYSRYQVRIEEMLQSCKIIRQAVQKVKALGKNAPYRLKVPSNVPAGRSTVRLEDPRGESLMYLISDGTDKPYRLKVRSPIFTNVSAAKPLVQGCRIADVPVVMAMIDMCLGETDR